MVFTSSPVRLRGSTRKEPPSISPTPRSRFVWAAAELLSSTDSCVPPVIRSVFSGLASLGTKAGSTEVSSSGGGLSAPMLGISLAMVELLLVMCGFRGFSFWIFSCSPALACLGAFWIRREDVVANERRMGRAEVRGRRRRARAEAMVVIKDQDGDGRSMGGEDYDGGEWIGEIWGLVESRASLLPTFPHVIAGARRSRHDHVTAIVSWRGVWLEAWQ